MKEESGARAAAELPAEDENATALNRIFGQRSCALIRSFLLPMITISRWKWRFPWIALTDYGTALYVSLSRRKLKIPDDRS
jgi:hypothetical protein